MATVNQISPNNFELQTYNSKDESLLLPANVNTLLEENSFIELHIYTPNKTLINSVSNFKEYSTPSDASSTSPDNLNWDISLTILEEVFQDLSSYLAQYL